MATNTMPAAIGGNESEMSSFVERLADKVGGKSSAAAVYGEPVERNGVTVIPVAKVRWGFGGGAGSGQQAEGESGGGSGGGGGAIARPVGYIELHDGSSRFHRIDDPSEILPMVALMVAASGFTTFLVLRGIARIIAAGRGQAK